MTISNLGGVRLFVRQWDAETAPVLLSSLAWKILNAALLGHIEATIVFHAVRNDGRMENLADVRIRMVGDQGLEPWTSPV